MSNDLLPCPFCGGEVGFHKDEDCNGCHYIWCHSCDGMFDLSAKADPENDTETLEELNERIAPIWNNRAQQSAPAGYVMVPVEMIDSFPEINPNNYSHDQVCDLNAWGCDLVLAALAAAPKAECTNSDSWNCKYCNKTKDCEALKDPRNFAAPKAEPVQRPVAQVSIDVDGSNKRLTWYSHKAMHEIPEWTKLYAAPQPVANQLIKGMADALRHALKELDTETPEDIDYGQLYSALAAYEAFKVEPAHSDDARDALVVALDALIADYDGEIHNEYGGTSMLDSRLSEINYAREALAAYRAAQEKK